MTQILSAAAGAFAAELPRRFVSRRALLPARRVERPTGAVRRALVGGCAEIVDRLLDGRPYRLDRPVAPYELVD